MSVAVLVPRRRDHGQRDALWDYCADSWNSAGFNVVVGEYEDPGPFNTSAAFNRAARTAFSAIHDVDVFVLMGADHVPNVPAVEAGVEAARRHGWAPLFAATHGVTRRDTRRILRGGLNPYLAQPAQTAPFCTALLAVRTDVWIEIGGMDERFAGWGCEDVALRMVLDTLYPDPPQPDPSHGVLALWHEAAPRDRFDANAALVGEYVARSGDPASMRELIERLKEQ